MRSTSKEVRNIQGKVYLDVIKKPDGSLYPVDGDTYQFAQERGLVVTDSSVVGLVAILPIGMAQVFSVNLTGEDFGVFCSADLISSCCAKARS